LGEGYERGLGVRVQVRMKRVMARNKRVEMRRVVARVKRVQV
jgi:hypothetical protein